MTLTQLLTDGLLYRNALAVFLEDQQTAAERAEDAAWYNEAVARLERTG